MSSTSTQAIILDQFRNIPFSGGRCCHCNSSFCLFTLVWKRGLQMQTKFLEQRQRWLLKVRYNENVSNKSSTLENKRTSKIRIDTPNLRYLEICIFSSSFCQLAVTSKYIYLSLCIYENFTSHVYFNAM